MTIKNGEINPFEESVNLPVLFKFANISDTYRQLIQRLIYAQVVQTQIKNMEVNCTRSGRHPLKSHRIISKSGERNINFVNVPQRSKRYIQDFINTIVS